MGLVGVFGVYPHKKCEAIDRFFQTPDRGSLFKIKVPRLSYKKAEKNYSQMKKKLKSISWTPLPQTKTKKPPKNPLCIFGFWGFLIF